MPLTFVKPGDMVKIKDIIGGGVVYKLLMEMGLNKGSKIKMIKNSSGPIIVAVGERRIAVGRGMAMKVMVM